MDVNLTASDAASSSLLSSQFCLLFVCSGSIRWSDTRNNWWSQELMVKRGKQQWVISKVSGIMHWHIEMVFMNKCSALVIGEFNKVLDPSAAYKMDIAIQRCADWSRICSSSEK